MQGPPVIRVFRSTGVFLKTRLDFAKSVKKNRLCCGLYFYSTTCRFKLTFSILHDKIKSYEEDLVCMFPARGIYDA